MNTRKYVIQRPDVGRSFDLVTLVFIAFVEKSSPNSFVMQAYFRRSRSRKEWASDILQIFHFLVVLGYLWAGLVEFIRNPPFFDAYGDAATRNSLPEGLFEVRIPFKYFINTSKIRFYYQ